jgi:hypothetical protein
VTLIQTALRFREAPFSFARITLQQEHNALALPVLMGRGYKTWPKSGRAIQFPFNAAVQL